MTKLLLPALGFLAFTNYTLAQKTTTWTGTNSSAVNVNGNWDNGEPGRPDLAVFDDPTTVTNQPNLPAGMSNNRLQVNSILFNNAGWNITADVDPGNPKIQMWNSGAQITSNGAGTNQIARLSTNASNVPVTVASGNTLIVHDSASEYLKIIDVNGTGTFILGGNIAGIPIPDAESLAGTFILNGLSSANIFADQNTIASGGVLGGIGTVTDTNGVNYTFESGATFAPGDVGIGNTSAGTMTFDTNVTKSRANSFNLSSGSIMAIDLFADGTSDMLSIGSLNPAHDAYNFNIASGVTLALSGTITGTTYTIAQINAGGDLGVDDVFDTVTLNGEPIDPGIISVVYNPHAAGDPGSGSIQLVVVPEPGVTALLLGAGTILGAVYWRRRRV